MKDSRGLPAVRRMVPRRPENLVHPGAGVAQVAPAVAPQVAAPSPVAGCQAQGLGFPAPVRGGNETPQRRWSTKGEGKDKVDLMPVKQVSPCVVWVGKADENEREDLNKRAEALDVDILAIFSLTLHQARTGNLTNNKAILRLTYFRGGKWQPLPGYAADPIINLDVEKWRQKDLKGTDPVEAEILKMLEAMDKALKPVPLPEAVNAERAKKRIADLVAAKPEEPLPVLVEARYYLVKGLIGENDFLDAAKTLLGEDGFAKLAARANEGAQ